MEQRSKQWLVKAKTRAKEGTLNRMVEQELFDHTWIASIMQLENNLKITAGQKVLDAGCGWGRLVFGLKYFHRSLEIDGYELTPEFVQKAEEVLNSANLQDNVRIMHGDLLEIDLPKNHYDSFYSSRVLHYIEDKKTVIQKLYGSLKSGGRGLIILPNKSCPYRWFTYKHAPLFPITTVGKLMEDVGFTKVYYGGYGFLPAGKLRFSYDSSITAVERYLASTRLSKYGGLAYVVGEKQS
jgi:ubiquinone/menaquinone biosynthesis C-methylase UbiE